jgi:hypothetical protein
MRGRMGRLGRQGRWLGTRLGLGLDVFCLIKVVDVSDGTWTGVVAS